MTHRDFLVKCYGAFIITTCLEVSSNPSHDFAKMSHASFLQLSIYLHQVAQNVRNNKDKPISSHCFLQVLRSFNPALGKTHARIESNEAGIVALLLLRVVGYDDCWVLIGLIVVFSSRRERLAVVEFWVRSLLSGERRWAVCSERGGWRGILGV